MKVGLWLKEGRKGERESDRERRPTITFFRCYLFLIMV